MAADAPTLTEERRKAGLELLTMLDDAGFGALGAAWVRDVSSEGWYYLLITPMIDSKGPYWLYDRLLPLFRKRGLPNGISPLDITLASPRQLDMRSLAFLMKFDGSASGAVSVVSDLTVNGFEIGYIAIYRMLPMPVNAGERAQAFDTRVQQLMAA